LKHFLIKLAQKASKGRINISHIEEEIDRHFSIMKLSLLIFLPILLLSLIFLFVKGLFFLYLDMFFISIAAFVAASFFPDILTLLAFCLHKNRHRLFHSSKGLLISSMLGFVLFMSFLPFHKSLFITSMIFAGYATHLSIDKVEKLQEFLCSIIKRFQEKRG